MANLILTVNLTYGANFAVGDRVATTQTFIANITANIPTANNAAQVVGVAYNPNQQNPASAAIQVQYHQMLVELEALKTDVLAGANATAWPGAKTITFS